MEFMLPVALVAISLTAIVVVLAILRKRKRTSLLIAESVETASPGEVLLSKGDNRSELYIPIELLPATTHIEETSLIEITDQTVLARISQALPAAAGIAARTLSAHVVITFNIIYNTVPYRHDRAVWMVRNRYSVIIPKHCFQLIKIRLYHNSFTIIRIC